MTPLRAGRREGDPVSFHTAVWAWLGTASSAVVFSVCITAVAGLATWTWAIADEVKDQAAIAAVAAEQARSANIAQQAVETRLLRIEVKLDRMMEMAAELQARDPFATRRPKEAQ